MAKPTTRSQFKDYCLRRLGHPVIQINVDDDQIEDRIDDALQFFEDYHFDGVEKLFMKHQITEEDISRRWIYVPDPVIFVTGIFPFDDSNSSINMFDLRYQLRLHDLYDFTSVSYVSYEITMQHIQTLNLLFSGKPQFRFNRHQNKLFLDIDWSRDVRVGEYVVVECYRAMRPDTVTLTGTVTGNTTSNTLVGYGTTFDQQIVENDFIVIGGESKQVGLSEDLDEVFLANLAVFVFVRLLDHLHYFVVAHVVAQFARDLLQLLEGDGLRVVAAGEEAEGLLHFFLGVALGHLRAHHSQEVHPLNHARVFGHVLGHQVFDLLLGGLEAQRAEGDLQLLEVHLL